MSQFTRFAACTAILSACVAFADVRYRLFDTAQLPLPQYLNFVTGITDSGRLVGTSTDGDLESFGFVIDPDGTIHVISVPNEGYFWGDATGGNEAGHVVGHYDAISSYGGYIWTPSAGVTLLGLIPGWTVAQPQALNESDVVCGSGTGGAFRWSAADGMTALGMLPGDNRSEAQDINDAGTIVGRSGIGNVEGRAVYWTNDTGIHVIPELEDGRPEMAHAINNAGQVVGRATTSQGRRAFIWDSENGITLLPTPPGYDSYAIAYDINERGVVAGMSAYEFEPSRFHVQPFIWDAQHGTRALGSLLDPCISPTPFMVSANVIGNDGRISVYTGAYGGYLLTPYLQGDLDASGAVDLQDLATLLAHFGQSGSAVFADGDSDCDADVDLQDLATLLSDFGRSLP